MPRYIITIRKPDQPTVYYLSKRGLRCYTAEHVAIYRTLGRAEDELEYFIRMMPAFRLTIEQLPPRMRAERAVLFAVEIAR